MTDVVGNLILASLRDRYIAQALSTEERRAYCHLWGGVVWGCDPTWRDGLWLDELAQRLLR